MQSSLCHERLTDADATVRRLAVIDLPYSDEDDIVSLLLPRLDDDDASVRTEAVRALEGFEERRRRDGARRALARRRRRRCAKPPPTCSPS